MRFLNQVLVLVALFGLNAQAAEAPEVLSSLKQIEQLSADYVGNGHVEIKKYSLSEFNMPKQIAEIRDQYQSGQWNPCKFNVVVGRTENLKAIKGLDLVRNEPKVLGLLKKLHREGELNTILSAQWDQKSGEAVSCNVNYFEVYTVGGSLLVLNIEDTD